MPLGLTGANRQARDSRELGVVARLAPGATIRRARAELEAIADATSLAPGSAVDVRSLRETLVGPVSTRLWLVGGASLLVGLAAMASLAALAVSRALSRQGDFAIRAALRASRAGLLVAFGMEFLLLGLAGAAAAAIAGGAVARAAARAVPAAIGSGTAYLETGLPAGHLAVVAVALRLSAACRR